MINKSIVVKWKISLSVFWLILHQTSQYAELIPTNLTDQYIDWNSYEDLMHLNQTNSL